MIVPGLGDLAVFPCSVDKRPLVKAWKAAAKRIEPPSSWPLVGVPTGESAGFDVLDVDVEGLGWFDTQSLPLTRMHQSQSGGFHLLFRHSLGLRNSADHRIARGIHVRAEDGFAIFWPRQGLPVCDAPIAEWPKPVLALALGACRKRNLPRGRVHRWNGAERYRALEALCKLNPVDYREHDEWLRLMMAAHAAGIDRETFIEWSIGDPLYANEAEEIGRRWDSLKPDGGVTARVLFVEARLAERSATAKAAMEYCDGEKCKGSVPAWPVHLTSHTSGFLRQINGVPLDVITNMRPIDEVIGVFERWLILKDRTPIYAVLGAVAANLLEGDPVWLGLIAPPSSAKTEILNSLSGLPYNVVQASSLSPASFLSATSKKDQDQQATGGLLRQIGEFGIIVLKDFTTMLALRPEMQQEVLAILREVYDGRYTRHVGMAIPSGEHQTTSGHFHRLDPSCGSGSAVRAAEITRGEVAFPRMALTETVWALYSGRYVCSPPVV